MSKGAGQGNTSDSPVLKLEWLAIAMGFQDIDLIRTPPRPQKKASRKSMRKPQVQWIAWVETS